MIPVGAIGRGALAGVNFPESGRMARRARIRAFVADC
jgi:hypothetical protein